MTLIHLFSRAILRRLVTTLFLISFCCFVYGAQELEKTLLPYNATGLQFMEHVDCLPFSHLSLPMTERAFTVARLSIHS